MQIKFYSLALAAYLFSSLTFAQTLNTDCDKTSSVECDVVHATNLERKNNGLPPLKVLSNCVAESQFHAEDMATHNYFSHDGLSETWAQRMIRFGVPGSKGENIAAGQATVPEVMTAWMNSPGHRENILSANYKSMSASLARGGDYGYYWVQCFSSADVN